MPVQVFGSLAPKYTSSEPQRQPWRIHVRDDPQGRVVNLQGPRLREKHQVYTFSTNTTSGRIPLKSDSNPLRFIVWKCLPVDDGPLRPLHAG